ncbi:GLPGLI family protein [Chryseobacterium indologenes]|uniref:GLPGLI family protein n=1 Tax=Chryseobacterium indologenes TaxID=253 RepID=UPI0009E753A0|nr:GLPGLI family protein [Chryseobacterium indologenes]
MRLLVLLSVVTYGLMYSQSNIIKSQYEVIYRVKMLRDTLAKENVIEEDLSLLVNGQKSLFKSTQKAVSDSALMAIGKEQFENPVNGKVVIDLRKVPSVRFPSEVYFDNGKQTVYKELLKNQFAYPLGDIIDSKLHNETRKIGSYTCKKAEGTYKGRHYIAWYTNEIPISDGPYVFKGLPGLILEIFDTKGYTIFSMISIKKAEKPIIPIKEAISTTYQAFCKARQNYLDDPAGTVSARTGIALKPANIESIKSRIRSNNNFID